MGVKRKLQWVVVFSLRRVLKFYRNHIGVHVNARKAARIVHQNSDRYYKNDDAYLAYVQGQILKSRRVCAGTQWVTVGASDSIQFGFARRTRTKYLVGLLDQALGVANREALTALCVGCRNPSELDLIETQCAVGQTVGLDLFSVDPRIEVGDMHDMPFAEDGFDILYSCHSLEHAYDLERAVGEFLRVTRPGGLLVVEMPVRYACDDVDCQDVKSMENLIALFDDGIDNVIFAEEEDGLCRIIVRKKSKASAAQHHNP